MAKDRETSWKWISVVSVVCLIGVTLAAKISGYWVLTALPVGFLFGFFLEKGDLCGASAFSEILLLKDWKKMQGIGVVIVVSMLGFSLLDGLGMVKLSPKPLLWASSIIGGVIFGVGTVLAGACVSGSLFKVAQGNLNSMAALVAIPIGVMWVEHGSLKAFQNTLQTYVVKNTDGGPVTFFSLLHLPYWSLSIIFAILTICAVIFFRHKNRLPLLQNHSSGTSKLKTIMTSRWRPWQAGIAIGLLACLAYLSSAASGRTYPLGVTHGVMHAELLLTDTPLEYVYAPKNNFVPPAINSGKQEIGKSPKKVSLWLLFEVFAIVLGAFVSAKLTGRARLLPKPPQQTITAFFGGLLVGVGAAIAGGCIVGNIMSGVALMSVGPLIFAVVVILTNWITTYFYLMGGSLSDMVWIQNYFKK